VVDFAAFGASFGLGAADRGVLTAAVERARSLGWTKTRRSENPLVYYFRRIADRDDRQRWFEFECAGQLIHRAADLEELLDAFCDHARLQTACRAKGVLFVHAAVAGWHDRGIVVPGRSGAGKTTLVRALIEAGADYYSDEFAVLDTEGRVHAYPVPLSIRVSGKQPARRCAEELGGRVGTRPIRVELIVSTEYQRGARWQPRELSNAEAVLALMEHTVAARQPPELTLPVLHRTVLAARAIRSRRGDSRAIAERVLRELA
jgi:hypothetical protein